MKAIRMLGAMFALLLFGLIVAARAGSVLPLPSVTGPTLGDPTTNLYSIMQALQNNTTSNYYSFTTLTVNAGPNTATQLQYGFNFLTAASGTTPSLVLPTAKPGAQILIANNTAQNLAIYASVSPYTVGLTDSINGTVGSTAYVPLTGTNGGFAKTVDCIAPQGGNWWCTTGF